MKTVKKGLRKSAKVGSLECQLARLLFQYRITPHSTTGVAPAELIFNRQIRSHISQVEPDLSSHVESKQLAQKRQHDVHCKERVFEVDDPVLVKNFGDGPTWLPGIVKEVQGPLSYTVTLLMVARYINMLIKLELELLLQPTSSQTMKFQMISCQLP